MPVRRRGDKRRTEVTDEPEAWLHRDDKGSKFIQYAPAEELAALWGTHSERIVAEHVSVYPGTRPARWWQYVVEPRQRLGGIGTPASDVLAHVPTFSFGLPSVWFSQRQVKYYTGVNHGGPIGSRFPSSDFKGVSIDPNDPPTFESQAAYLKRHGFLLGDEERRLKKADWEAEAISKRNKGTALNRPLARVSGKLVTPRRAYPATRPIDAP